MNFSMVLNHFFDQTQKNVDRAVVDLERLITAYEKHNHPNKVARINAIKAKISVLRDVKLNPDAHPWNED